MAQGEGFLSWYSVKSPYNPGVGEWGMPLIGALINVGDDGISLNRPQNVGLLAISYCDCTASECI